MTQFKDIPNTTHYAILTKETFYIPGDERSRTYPGHGYPAENIEVVNYRVFLNKEDWTKEIDTHVKMGHKPDLDFKAISVSCAQIETQVTVKVS